VPPHLREGGAGHQDSNKKWERKYRYCGDKWSPGHKCNSKKLYTCEEEKESNTSHMDSDNESEEEVDAPNTKPEEAMPKISLATITGIAQPQTLKLRGHVKNDNVTIIVDTGSTYKFMDTNVARKLNLFIYLTVYIRVMVVDGKKIDGVGKFHKVKLQIEDYELEIGFYTVPLGAVDVVLGIQWLQILGTYYENNQK
jgi:hypothetical protein